MIEPLRPARDGFLRPFGTAWFIREFLLGNGPMGSPRIDPDVGSTQTDIHRYYKEALHRVWAEDMVARDEEERIRMGHPPFSIEEAEHPEKEVARPHGIPIGIYRQLGNPVHLNEKDFGQKAGFSFLCAKRMAPTQQNKLLCIYSLRHLLTFSPNLLLLTKQRG